MQIQTISLCAGEGKCPRRCPYCVSRQTGLRSFTKMPSYISWKVKKALRLAELSGVSTALITGKGEPLFTDKSRDHVFQYLQELRNFKIPFIELQTSGYGLDDETIHELKLCGVTTIAISCVSDDLRENRKIYGPDYEDPFLIADRLHAHGIMVRLALTMTNECTPTHSEIKHMIQTCADCEIEQLSLVPVTAPEKTANPSVTQWVRDCGLSDHDVNSIYRWVHENGDQIMTLMHGGRVYDINGVSVCTRYCLTEEPDSHDLRQVIVFPNGETRYSWTHGAARLIRGD